MLKPLWNGHRRPRLRTIPENAAPMRFDVMGKNFIYEPNDMRLYLAGGPCGDDYLNHDWGATGRWQFPLNPAEPRMVVLVVTHACTLRCRYCFAAPEDSSAPRVMSLETAKEALNLLEAGRDFTIGFFGGEPLIAFSLIEKTVAYAKEFAKRRGVRAKFSVTTNATLLDDRIARFLRDNDFSLIVSLDGPQELHDDNRPTASGEGSYHLTLRGLRTVAQYPELARRTTLRATFDGAGETRLLQRLKHLNHVRRELGLANVSVEPADLSEGCNSPVRAKPLSISEPGLPDRLAPNSGPATAALPCPAAPVHVSPELFDEYMEAAKWFVEESKAGLDPKFHHFEVRMKRLVSRMPAPSECGAGVGYAAADVDGKLYACHRLGECKIGELPHGIDLERQSEWRDNRYYSRKRCSQCWLRNVCGGGCRLNSIHHNGGIAEPDRLGCWVTETCVKAAAWILSELR